MGHQEKAKKVLWVSALAFIPIAAILFFIPEFLARFAALGIEAGCCAIFPVIQGKEFAAWEAAHAAAKPSSGWKAIGWGFAGLLLFLVLAVSVFTALAVIFPGRV